MIDTIENHEDLYNLEFLSREYLEMHKLKCEKCQKYRVECAFSPHCIDRRHLNILIQLQTSKNHRLFPNYCYSLYVKNVNDFLNNKETLTSSNDSWIYLEDFLELFKKELGKKMEKDNKKLFQKLLSIWEQNDIPLFLERNFEKQDQFNFIYGKTIFRINFPINIIIVDVNHRICHSDEELENYLDILSRYYKLESIIELIKDTNDLWYLKFKSKALDKTKIEEKLSKISDYFNIFKEDDEFNFIIEIKTSVHKYSHRKIQNYTKLRTIFQTISENLKS